MVDTTAMRHVLDGFRADIARRAELLAGHRAAVAELEAANATDARSAAVAEALIDVASADAGFLWCPAGDMEAAALVADMALICGMPSTGKTVSARLALEALASTAGGAS